LPSYNSGWSSIQLDGVKSLVLAQRASETLAYMRRRGIAIPVSNRLQRAITLTERVNAELTGGAKFADYSDAQRAQMAESWRTMWEAFVVGHAISQRRASTRAITDELLTSFLQGADLPTGDADPWPRNTQFEAATAAFLIQSGIAVTRDEPDFRIEFYNERAGVAVKRLTSIKPTKVYDRLREGARQLCDNDCRGFISLSIDNWVTDLGADRDPAAVGRLFNEQVRDAHAQLDRVAERPAVLGVFLTVSWSRWELRDGMPYLQWSVPQQVHCFADSAFSEEQYARFFDPARTRQENSLRELVSLVD
jgi:hypothetical protein